jgi:2-polyprenyl-3-methyl-5-hydroxy-6-metoxy-1,4-benzoquinol methylase
MRSARDELLGSHTLADSEIDLINQVSLRVDRRDGMYKAPDAVHYLSVGLSAMRCVDQALAGRAGNEQSEIHQILDLPCGYGRVLRFLKVRFPAADITASEIEEAALAFCQREFSVTPLRSTEKLAELACSSQFDLIWCGSLVTHLDEESTTDLLRFLANHLSPSGACVLTTCGQHIFEAIRAGANSYGLSEGEQARLVSSYLDSGYGFGAYDDHPDYGISVVSAQRLGEIARSAGLTHEIVFLERGWDEHQDVFGFMAGN